MQGAGALSAYGDFSSSGSGRAAAFCCKRLRTKPGQSAFEAWPLNWRRSDGDGPPKQARFWPFRQAPAMPPFKTAARAGHRCDGDRLGSDHDVSNPAGGDGILRGRQARSKRSMTSMRLPHLGHSSAGSPAVSGFCAAFIWGSSEDSAINARMTARLPARTLLARRP